MDAKHAKTDARLLDPNLKDDIIAHVSSGGSLIELCKIWDVFFHRINSWIYANHKDEYELAIKSSTEYLIQRVRDEIKLIGTVDIRKAYDQAGNLLPPSKWPDDLACAISSIETSELCAQGEKIADVRRIKLWDKLKALELLGKNLSMFVDKHEVTGRVTLEDIVSKSLQGGEVETRQAHTLENAGANPAPANL